MFIFNSVYIFTKINALKSRGIDTSGLIVIPSDELNELTGQNARGLKNNIMKMWTPLKPGGPVTVPWTVQEDLMKAFDTIKNAISHLETVLGCFHFPYVSESERSTTEYENGVIFKIDDYCWASYGKTPGYRIEDEDGVPENWQMIGMMLGCAKKFSTIQHEMLHALGVGHEQSRADRDEYINFFPERSNDKNQWVKFSYANWYETAFAYEPGSLMQYSSKQTAADASLPVATFKDGSLIPGGNDRITTTDALQLQTMYCKDQSFESGEKWFPDFELSETTRCSSADAVGAYRHVFTSYLCDGKDDC